VRARPDGCLRRSGRAPFPLLRPAEEPALAEIHAQFPCGGCLFRGLDALGEHPAPVAVGHADDRGDDGFAEAPRQGLHDVLIELHHVGLQAHQHVQRRVAGAEVIDGHHGAAAPVVVEDVAEVVDVADVLAFGHLEHQLVQAHPGFLRRLGGGGQTDLGTVDGGRHEVDEQQLVPEPAMGTADGRRSTDAVQDVQPACFCRCREHLVGEDRPVRAGRPQQRLVPDDGVVVARPQ
jgi:hypothetical protein